MRVALQHGTVHERAGVALVSVAGHVLLIGLGAVGELPLQARGETAAAAAAQAGLEDFVDDLLAGHAGQRLFQRLVAVEGQVFVNVFGVDHAAVAQSDALLVLVEVNILQALVGVLLVGGVIGIHQVLHVTALEQMLGDDLVHILYLYAGVEGAFGVYDDNGAGLAQAKAARADNLDFLFQAGFFDFLLKALDDLRRAGRRTTGTAAAEHMCAIDIHGQFLL